MNIPKVTVIIVFLNEETYLAEAIDSVFRQTWQDWELLLVDDGSTDRSTEIAGGFQMRFPERVKYFEHGGHVNRGISISRNLGISHARGEYIAFLDADDIWISSKLEQQVTILDRDPDLAMTFGRLRYFTSEPDLPIPEGVAPLRVPSGVLHPPVVFTQSLIGDAGMLWTPGTILFRKRILIAAGSFETDFPGAGEDAIVWLKINLHFPIYASDECLLLYRRHSRATGIQDWRNGRSAAGWALVMKWVYQYTQQQPAAVRQWAIPIVREALFRSLLGEIRSILRNQSSSFLKRYTCLARACVALVWRYPELINKNRCRRLIKRLVRLLRGPSVVVPMTIRER